MSGRKGPETLLKEKVMRLLKGMPGMYVVKQHGGMYGTAGVPDLLICASGRFVGIELKVPGGKATPLQLNHIEQIKHAGGVAAVCDSIESVQDVLRTMHEGA